MEKVDMMMMTRKADFVVDFRSKYFDTNELLQIKYPTIYTIIHSTFIIITAFIIILMEIIIGLQSTFLSQIVDASISTGITIGILYMFIAVLQLTLIKKRYLGLLITTACAHLFAIFGSLNLCSTQIQTILALNKVPDLYRFKIMEMLEESEMRFITPNGLILLFLAGLLSILLSTIFWIIMFKSFICVQKNKKLPEYGI